MSLQNLSNGTYSCTIVQGILREVLKCEKVQKLVLSLEESVRELLLGNVARLVEVISTVGKSKQKLSFPIIRTGQRATALLTACLPQLQHSLHHIIRISYTKMWKHETWLIDWFQTCQNHSEIFRPMRIFQIQIDSVEFAATLSSY